MAIITVDGVIQPEKLGITSVHEHLLIDLTWAVREPKDVVQKAFFNKKIEMKNLGVLRRMPLAMRDNCLLDDPELIEEELLEFKRAGGGTIVELSCHGFNLDPVSLRRISRAVGTNIIASTGFYTQNLHPSGMNDMSVRDLENVMLADIQTGIGGSGVRAGVIGEMGVSAQMHPNEKKALIAAAHVSKSTGLAIMVHISGGSDKRSFPLGLTAIEVLTSEGADAQKVAICHADSPLDINVEYCLEILKMGAYISFDNYNHEHYVAKKDREQFGGAASSDLQRVRVTKLLVDKGYAERILVGQDTCFKTMLHAYGGYGLDHIMTNIVPMMLDEGITDAQIKSMYIENPLRWLDDDKVT
jgi:phosphotriesterase-related protein